MNVFRNRFLGTTSFLLDPREPTNDGTQQDGNDGGDDNGNDDAGDDTSAEAGEDAGDGSDDGETGGDEGDEGDDEDDPDLAELPPEVRAKAKAAIDKRVARETGWRDRQLNKLHAKVRTAQEDVEAAGRIVGNRTDGTAAPVPENLTETQIEERAKVLAGNMTAQQEYDRNANDADARGQAIYKEKWKTTMAKLPKLGGVDINDMVDILNTDKPHVVLYSLADPDTYERVMALPPARRRTEYVKLSLKEEPKQAKPAQRESKRPGDIPAPVNQVSNGRRTAAQQVNLADDKVSDDAWYAARNATRRKKFSHVE